MQSDIQKVLKLTTDQPKTAEDNKFMLSFLRNEVDLLKRILKTSKLNSIDHME